MAYRDWGTLPFYACVGVPFLAGCILSRGPILPVVFEDDPNHVPSFNFGIPRERPDHTGEFLPDDDRNFSTRRLKEEGLC